MSDWKRVYLTVFCVLFFSCILYGYAEVRNVSISSECYNPGEEITISFEVRSTSAYQNIYGSIIFSENTTPVYNDDCVWHSGGAQDPPDTDGHDGGFLAAQGADPDVWHSVSKTIKVPFGYSGYKNIIAAVAENYMQLYEWGGHIENSANAVMTQCVLPTATPTPTAAAGVIITPVAGIRLEYKPGGTDANAIEPFIRIYNDSDISIPLSDSEIRYWYLFEGEGQDEIAAIHSAAVFPGNTDIAEHINGSIIQKNRGTQDRYLEITFGNGAGTIEPGQYVEIKSSIIKSDGSDYDQSNDWSYNAEFMDYERWGKILFAIQDVVGFGADPYKMFSPIIVRVDCGQPSFNDEFTDSQGNVWEFDREYTPGGWLSLIHISEPTRPY